LRRAEAVRGRSCGAARAGEKAKAAADDRADRLVRRFAWVLLRMAADDFPALRFWFVVRLVERVAFQIAAVVRASRLLATGAVAVWAPCGRADLLNETGGAALIGLSGISL
jgi:hypothetical protein